MGDTVDETIARYRECLEALFDLIRTEGGEYPVPKTVAMTIEIDDVA